MKRMTVSLKIDEDLWREVKHYCIDAKMQYSSFVEHTLKEKLGKKK